MPDGVVVAAGLSSDSVRRLAGRYGRSVVVDFGSDAGNSLLDLADLAALGGDALPLRLQELVLLAAGVVQGDVALPRGRNEGWSRQIVVHFASSEPERLSAVAQSLSTLLGFVMGDAVSLAVEKAEVTPEVRRRSRPITLPVEGADCACLLSGGIDSLAGATALLAAGRRPVFFMHASGNPAVADAQRSARRALDERFGPQPVVAVPLQASARPRPRFPYPEQTAREPSRRSRSFLPLALAVAGCSLLGHRDLYVPENGILAAQLPLTRARIGSMTTRTTHPRWLGGLARVVSDYLETPVRITNPLLGQTKAELVRDVLLPALGEQAVRATTSCWLAGRRSVPCGGCVPCILRRMAFECADLFPEAVDEDILSDSVSRSGMVSYRNLVAVLSLVSDFGALQDDRLWLRYPELAYADGESAAVVATIRRFAAEVHGLARGRFPLVHRLLGQRE
jgi:hypothetical protein